MTMQLVHHYPTLILGGKNLSGVFESSFALALRPGQSNTEASFKKIQRISRCFTERLLIRYTWVGPSIDILDPCADHTDVRAL